MKRKALIGFLTILSIAAIIVAGYYALPVIVKNIGWIFLGFVCLFVLGFIFWVSVGIYEWIEEQFDFWDRERTWKREQAARQEWLDSLAKTNEPEDTDI